MARWANHTQVVFCLVMVLSTSALTRAQTVHWLGPDRCGTAPPALNHRVRELGDIGVFAEVREQRGTLHLELVITRNGRRFHRTLEATSCDALGQTAVVLVNLVGEPESGASMEPQEPESGHGSLPSSGPASAPPIADLPASGPTSELPASSPIEESSGGEEASETGDALIAPSSTSAPHVDTSAPEPLENSGASMAVRLDLGGRVDVGSLPAAQVAPELRLTLVFPYLRAEIAGAYLAERTAMMGTASAALSLLLGQAGVCAGAGNSGWWLGGCGRFEFGRISAAGRGVDRPEEKTTFWSAIELSARLEVHLWARLSVYAEAGAALPFARPSFLLRGAEVHRSSIAVPRFALGVEIRLTNAP